MSQYPELARVELREDGPVLVLPDGTQCRVFTVSSNGDFVVWRPLLESLSGTSLLPGSPVAPANPAISRKVVRDTRIGKRFAEDELRKGNVLDLVFNENTQLPRVVAQRVAHKVLLSFVSEERYLFLVLEVGELNLGLGAQSSYAFGSATWHFVADRSDMQRPPTLDALNELIRDHGGKYVIINENEV